MRRLDDDIKNISQVEVIAYHFYTTEGDEHCVINLLHNDYIN